MFKNIVIGLLVAVSVPAFAGDQLNAPVIQPTNVTVQNETLGTGAPESLDVNTLGYALPDGVYHVPQYMPGSPTAATIYPRVVDVRCLRNEDGSLQCEGYHWTPDMGRAEYLLIHPVLVSGPKTIIKEVPVIVLKEVPVKKKNE